MRDYGKVRTSFWTDEKTSALSDRAKVLALYLLSGPHSNSIGCFRLPLGYIQEDLKWPFETVTETLSELSSKRFLDRCERSNWVFIRQYLRHNAPENPNVGKSMEPLVEAIPANVPFYNDFLNSLETVPKHVPKGLVERFRTVSRKEPEPEPEPEPNILSDRETVARRTIDEDFDDWWSGVWRKVGKGQAEKAYRAARKHAGRDELIVGRDHYAAQVEDKDPQYVKYPSTWLSGKCWLDEEPSKPPDNGTGPPADIYHTRVREFRDQIDAKQEPIWRQYRSDWGPAPDEPGCRASVGILEEFGFEPIAPEFLNRASAR